MERHWPNPPSKRDLLSSWGSLFTSIFQLWVPLATASTAEMRLPSSYCHQGCMHMMISRGDQLLWICTGQLWVLLIWLLPAKLAETLSKLYHNSNSPSIPSYIFLRPLWRLSPGKHLHSCFTFHSLVWCLAPENQLYMGLHMADS